ncbi:MAG TPA: hypothetical protein ENK46_03585 [Flavobacteriia bacterium]|nr:hypothetical protein [Flavobacteriia bacterium]
MKNATYLFLIILFFLSSCSLKKTNNENTKAITGNDKKIKLNLKKDADTILKNWVAYYKQKESAFSLKNFMYKNSDTLIVMQGTVIGNFDKNFDSIYTNFIVFNHDKNKYIDFDSYNWALGEHQKPLFSPDQEIDLVDLKSQTVNRIAFRGPLQWVEAVFWENDSTVVLLENSADKYPIITKLELYGKKIKTFKYLDSLKFESNYFQLRLRKKGIKL